MNDPNLSVRANELRDVLVGISLADHMGDVNDYLPKLCTLIGLEEPEWSDHYERYVFPWEEDEDEYDNEPEEPEGDFVRHTNDDATYNRSSLSVSDSMAIGFWDRVPSSRGDSMG